MSERLTIGNSVACAKQATSRRVVASGGCKPGVKKLTQKCTREARCRPPRSGARLRGGMVSSNEAGFNLRETAPLSLNPAWADPRGQRTGSNNHRGWLLTFTSPKDEAGNLVYPASVRDSAERGLGYRDNRHLNYS